jgi:16S rRNA (guanine527-N7)-methyltransferase
MSVAVAADRGAEPEALEPSEPSPHGDPPQRPVPPGIAAVVFGARLPLAVRYAEWLAGAGVERGLIGPHETDRLWDRHLLNCVAAAALIPVGSSVVDLGSGAGLPGIVLAIARPDLTVTLVEPMQRRAVFLEVVVADLGLKAVAVRRARAEDLKKPRLGADVVTARAVAPISRLVALAVPLLRVGGQLLALKGAGIVEEVAVGWGSVRRSAMGDDATLFAVLPGEPGAAIGADSATPLPSDAGWLPGVDLVARMSWSAQGASADRSDDANGTQSDVEALALILRLRRSAQGLSQTRRPGLG